MEIRENSSEPQIFEYIGTSAGEVPVEKEEVYKESERINGFMEQKHKDAVKLFSVAIGAIGAVARPAAAVAGIL